MFCRSFSWFIRIFVAVVISTGCSHPISVTEFYTEVTAHSLTTNKDSLTVGRVHEAEEATAEDLGALLDAGDGAVVTLLAGDTRLVAHRAVLAARSPVFADMLRRATLEGSSSQLVLSDTEGPVLRQVLAYLYTLQVPQLPSMAPKLLVAADKYGLSVLKAHCEQQVVAQLSVETAAATGVLAIRHSANRLKQAAIAFIKAHMLRVVATQGWAEAVVNDPQTVVELTHLVAETPTDTSVPSVQHAKRWREQDRPLLAAAQWPQRRRPEASHSCSPHLSPDDSPALRRRHLSSAGSFRRRERQDADRGSSGGVSEQGANFGGDGGGRRGEGRRQVDSTALGSKEGTRGGGEASAGGWSRCQRQGPLAEHTSAHGCMDRQCGCGAAAGSILCRPQRQGSKWVHTTALCGTAWTRRCGDCATGGRGRQGSQE
ncbi:uncharacterized protein LOC126427239 isoform X2 [Schistocerca serialis cubense]|uniref:uncharacterized protein LOC126427239 isoform X2 n=1 Tax=Schistocerca serialis cubense TaxID=2023355 RepID=UPI00214E12FA|nr:uncharacterized protein LOC126427239 isoform X2 [Schistocerca serialis cubense]